jgi:hypothetical protein
MEGAGTSPRAAQGRGVNVILSVANVILSVANVILSVAHVILSVAKDRLTFGRS